MQGSALDARATGSTGAPGSRSPAETILDFLRTLAREHQRLAERGLSAGPPAHPLDAPLAQLTLAEAALRHALSPHTRPPQLAVLGPTQTGKSTVVNLLLGCAVADVSPLAGFTVHPQGFADTDAARAGSAWRQDVLPGWRMHPPAELSREALEAYGWQVVPPRPDGRPWHGVIWDTPDFDTLSAQTYQRGVLEIAALADVHLVVLSKEKYSDLSVWKFLRLLAPLRRPLVICLNKLSPDSVELVRASLRERLAEFRPGDAACPTITLLYQRGAADAIAAEQQSAIGELRGALADEIVSHEASGGPAPPTSGARRDGRLRGAIELIRAHWRTWTAPIRAQHAAVGQWNDLLAELLGVRADEDDARSETFLGGYRRDFLDDPRRYDSFRRATVALLTLLDPPAAAGALQMIRGVVTWPARQIAAAGRALRARYEGSGGAARPADDERVLNDRVEWLLNRLQCEVGRRIDERDAGLGVWLALSQRLAQHRDEVRGRFAEAVREQRDRFTREIHAAAERIFATLKRHPALLNTLRTLRMGTDLAGVVIAVKTGGTVMADLALAPATLALTTLLTEGALGAYMRGIADDLKQRQFQSVKATLVEETIAPALRELSHELADERLIGVGLEQLAAADAVVASWARGATHA
jgi:hypothetical protein